MALTKNKKAAIELSIGVVVIIVLAMSMLILGIVLIRNIFSGAKDSVTQIDQGVKNEINKLFSENQERQLILYPTSGIIKLERGSQDGGFAVSIRNTDDVTVQSMRYLVKDADQGSCPQNPITTGTASIIIGKEETFPLGPNIALENPRHIRFRISDTAPTCTFSVRVELYINSQITTSDVMSIEILPN